VQDNSESVRKDKKLKENNQPSEIVMDCRGTALMIWFRGQQNLLPQA
jgi:hypothetical protein